MSEAINNDRRRFFGTAIMTLAAARFGATRFSDMSISTMTPESGIAVAAPTGSSFDSIKQIDAGVLNVGYAQAGPVNGPVVLLLHGWPYDIHAFEEVAPILAAKGYRVIIPYLRGYGTTRFLSDATMRSGQPAAVAVDIIALMDALKIEKAVIGGCDLGARTANIRTGLWPER